MLNGRFHHELTGAALFKGLPGTLWRASSDSKSVQTEAMREGVLSVHDGEREGDERERRQR